MEAVIRTEWRPAGDTFRVMTRGSSPATDNNESLFICYDNKSCGIIFIVVFLHWWPGLPSKEQVVVVRGMDSQNIATRTALLLTEHCSGSGTHE